ncbi:MAG: hypothetical protein QXM76_01490 [Zestosphaera sp.]
MLISLVSVSSELVFSAVSVTIPLTYNMTEYASPKQFVTAQPTYYAYENVSGKQLVIQTQTYYAYENVSGKQLVIQTQTYAVNEFLASRTAPTLVSASLSYNVSELAQDMNATEGVVTFTLTETKTETVTEPGRTYVTTYTTVYTTTYLGSTVASVPYSATLPDPRVIGIGAGLLILLLVLLSTLWGRRYG